MLVLFSQMVLKYELEATVFDKRDVAASKLDFELGTVVRCSKQHGLLFQGNPCFPC
jgi:hypothetical protein